MPPFHHAPPVRGASTFGVAETDPSHGIGGPTPPGVSIDTPSGTEEHRPSGGVVMDGCDTKDGAAVEGEILDLVDTLAKDQPREPRPVRRRGPMHQWIGLVLAIAVVVIGAGLTAANLAGMGPFDRGRTAPGPEDVRQQLELDLLASVGYVESFRDDHGRLPVSLDEVDIDAPADLSYQRISDDRFIVTLGQAPSSLSYDSGEGDDHAAVATGGSP